MIGLLRRRLSDLLMAQPGWPRRVAAGVVRRLPGRRVRWGNLRRLQPFSSRYGWDRGLPVDRWYIERWLFQHRADIRGHVLEVKEAVYSRRFGTPDAVTIVDVDKTNSRADLYADLNIPDSLPIGVFDCIVLTQVLQYLDPVTALGNIWRSLRPEGVLLLSVPAMSRTDPELVTLDRWRITPEGLRFLFSQCGIDAQIEGAGNVLVGLAGLLGLAAEDLSPDELAYRDARFPVCVMARAVKA